MIICPDIQFWNKNKSMEGLSAKSVVVSFICQLVIFLYLLDNETSWMILGSAGIGCCIEFWKIGKAMHIEVCEFSCCADFIHACFVFPPLMHSIWATISD
mgnify:FL=1